MNYEDLMTLDVDQYEDEGELVTVLNKGVPEQMTIADLRVIRERRLNREAPPQQRKRKQVAVDARRARTQAEVNEEEDEEEDEEEEGEGDFEIIRTKASVEQAVTVQKKRRKTTRKKRSRTKRALGWFLLQTVGEYHCCLVCDYRAEATDKFKPDNMERHWKMQHTLMHESVVASNDEGKDVAAVVKTLTNAKIQQLSGQMASFVVQKKRVKTQGLLFLKEVALLRWMVIKKIPFHSIDDDSFKDLQVSWGVKLEGAQTIKQLIPPMFELALELIHAELHACPSISVGIDLWTSLAKRKYLAITYHCIDDSWNMVHHLLDMIDFPGTTKAELIAACTEARVKSHAGADQLVAACVSDGGSDAKRARALMPYDSKDCGNHDLNLAQNDVFTDLKLTAAIDIATLTHFIDLLESDRNLWLFFEHMQEEAGYEDVLQFVTRNDTRWDGLYLALSRFIGLKDAIMVETEQAEELRRDLLEEWPLHLAQDVFQTDFFVRLGAYLELLQPLRIASKELQDLRRPTASLIPKHIHAMKSAWSKRFESSIPGVGELAKALHSSVTTRMDKYVDNPSNSLKAALLDPSQSRHVQSFGVATEVIDSCWKEILEEAIVNQNQALDLDLDSKKVLCEAQAKVLRVKLASCDVELQEKDPLCFYRDDVGKISTVCALMIPVVKMLLSIPGSESHCERVFSWAGEFITKKRTRTSNSLLEMQLVLYDLFRSNMFHWDTFQQLFLERMMAAAGSK